MARRTRLKNFMFLSLVVIIFAKKSLGGIITCENLSRDTCAFAISSSGERCVLEKSLTRGGEDTCLSSGIKVKKLVDWIETNECIVSCGLSRDSFGISSDSLMDTYFHWSLCSTKCYERCPNIADLYFNLAAAEGIDLLELCHRVDGIERFAHIPAKLKSTSRKLLASDLSF